MEKWLRVRLKSETPEILLSAYEAALNSHDVRRLDGLVDSYAVFIFTDGTFKGIDAIKDACRKTWGYFQNEIYQVQDIQWLDRNEQSASCHYRIEWSADREDKRQHFSGRGTTIMKNTLNGWVIIHEHLSRNPE